MYLKDCRNISDKTPKSLTTTSHYGGEEDHRINIVCIVMEKNFQR